MSCHEWMKSCNEIDGSISVYHKTTINVLIGLNAIICYGWVMVEGFKVTGGHSSTIVYCHQHSLPYQLPCIL